MAQEQLVEKKYPARKPARTKGGGDCAFHAALGEWDAIQEIYACQDIEAHRKKLHDAVLDKNSGPNIQELILAGIKELVMSGRIIGLATKKLRQHYQQFLLDQAISSPQSWVNFAEVLQREAQSNPDLLSHLPTLTHQSVSPHLSSLHAEFHDALNRNEGELYGLILSLPHLQAAFDTYNEISTVAFDWKGAIESNPLLIEEYAKFLGGQRQWLLASEVALIAHVFDVTVIYHPFPGAQPQTLNPHQVRTVYVQFNGRDHFERMVSSNEPGCKQTKGISASRASESRIVHEEKNVFDAGSEQQKIPSFNEDLTQELRGSAFPLSTETPVFRTRSSFTSNTHPTPSLSASSQTSIPSDSKFNNEMQRFMQIISEIPVVRQDMDHIFFSSEEKINHLIERLSFYDGSLHDAIQLKRELLLSISRSPEEIRRKKVLDFLSLILTFCLDLFHSNRIEVCLNIYERFFELRDKFKQDVTLDWFYRNMVNEYAGAILTLFDCGKKNIKDIRKLKDGLEDYFRDKRFEPLVFLKYARIRMTVYDRLGFPIETVNTVYKQFRDFYNNNGEVITSDPVLKNEAILVIESSMAILTNKSRNLSREKLEKMEGFLKRQSDLIFVLCDEKSIHRVACLMMIGQITLEKRNFPRTKEIIADAKNILSQNKDAQFTNPAFGIKMLEADYCLELISHEYSDSEKYNFSHTAYILYSELLQLDLQMSTFINREAIQKKADRVLKLMPNFYNNAERKSDHSYSFYSHFKKTPSKEERQEIITQIQDKNFQGAINLAQQYFEIGHRGITHKFLDPLGVDDNPAGKTRPGRTPRISLEAFAESLSNNIPLKGVEDVALALIIAHEDTHRRFFEHLGYIDWVTAKNLKEEGKLTKEEFDLISDLKSEELAFSEIFSYQSEIDNLNSLSLEIFPAPARRAWEAEARERMEMYLSDLPKEMQDIAVDHSKYQEALAYIRNKVPENLQYLIIPGKEKSVSYFNTSGQTFAPTSYLPSESAESEYTHDEEKYSESVIKIDPKSIIKIDHDSNSVLYAIICGYLWPIRSQEDEFLIRCKKLFGDDLSHELIERLRAHLEKGIMKETMKNDFLNDGNESWSIKKLVNKKLRPRIFDYGIDNDDSDLQCHPSLETIKEEDSYVDQNIFSLLEKMIDIKIKCFENENLFKLSYNDQKNLSQDIIVLVRSFERAAGIPSNLKTHFNWYPSQNVLNNLGITHIIWNESWSELGREDVDQEDEEEGYDSGVQLPLSPKKINESSHQSLSSSSNFPSSALKEHAASNPIRVAPDVSHHDAQPKQCDKSEKAGPTFPPVPKISPVDIPAPKSTPIGSIPYSQEEEEWWVESELPNTIPDSKETQADTKPISTYKPLPSEVEDQIPSYSTARMFHKKSQETKRNQHLPTITKAHYKALTGLDTVVSSNFGLVVEDESRANGMCQRN